MKRKRILYLMHVDWYSIKQRPQYLAETLSAYHDVYLAYPTRRFWKQTHRRVNERLVLVPMSELALRRKTRLAYHVDQLVYRIQLRRLIERLNPHLIWVSSPSQFLCIPSSFAKPLVYDCMDAAAEFSVRQWHRREMMAAEAALLRNAALVFASSHRLQVSQQARTTRGVEVVLLRNCFGGEILPREQQATAPGESSAGGGQPLRVCYFGAIAGWMDFSLLIGALNELQALEFHLIGPVGTAGRKWRHERLFFHGAVAHEELPAAVRDYHCFVMPFKLNELTLGVDPVKLYEYVNIGKPIVAVYYPEIERFRPFVDFYETEQAFVELLGRMIREGPKRSYTEAARVAFLRKNAWPERGKIMIAKLSQILGRCARTH